MELPSGHSLEFALVFGLSGAVFVATCFLAFDLHRHRSLNVKPALGGAAFLLVILVGVEVLSAIPNPYQDVVTVALLGYCVVRMWMDKGRETEDSPGPLPRAMRPKLPSERTMVEPEEAFFR